METLTTSSVKAFLENQREKGWNILCPTTRDCVFSRQELRVLGFRDHVNRGFPLSVSIPVRKQTVRCISSASALSSSETTETSTGDEEKQRTINTTQTKTVHVKFQLQRECLFGQQFFIVGDDPMFGLWDTSSAVPLNWSEGHVWKVELDMPRDKVIKYKLILKGAAGAVLWQPGPDRVFRTWETSKTITVSEDWEDAELQTIAEEVTVPDTLIESLEESAAMIVTANLPEPRGDPWDDSDKKQNSTNGAYPNPTEIPLAEKPMAIVAENITEQNGELEVDIYGISRERTATDANDSVTVGAKNFENKALSINGENLPLSKNQEYLDSDVGIPVLVPGLTPTGGNVEESVIELYKEIDSDASVGSDVAEEFSVPELNLEEESGTCLSIPEEENVMLSSDKQELQDKGVVEGHVDKPQLVEHNNNQLNRGMENEVLENDIQWGRKTLQQFLMSLGLF